MAHGTPYKPLIDSAILHLQEGGVLHKLRVKWWKQKRGLSIYIISCPPDYLFNFYPGSLVF